MADGRHHKTVKSTYLGNGSIDLHEIWQDWATLPYLNMFSFQIPIPSVTVLSCSFVESAVQKVLDRGGKIRFFTFYKNIVLLLKIPADCRRFNSRRPMWWNSTVSSAAAVQIRHLVNSSSHCAELPGNTSHSLPLWINPHYLPSTSLRSSNTNLWPDHPTSQVTFPQVFFLFPRHLPDTARIDFTL